IDVALAAECITRRVDEARVESSLPEAAGASIPIVEIADIKASKVSHEKRRRFLVRRCEHEVYVVRHEAVAVERALPALAVLAEAGEVDQPVTVFVKAGLSVVAALVNVQRYTGNDQPRMPRHDATTIIAAPRLTGRNNY